MVICNLACFNAAVEMGFGNDLNNAEKLSQQDIDNINEQMCCDFHENTENIKDKRKRVKLISDITDLMVYDLEWLKEGLSVDDI